MTEFENIEEHIEIPSIVKLEKRILILEGKYKALLNGMEIINNKVTELGWKVR